ncbi:MurR/RpiR family transcriptional regulator [Christensenella timonensis]|uniref:MurR/RpiR family transcriptional regulator n=1 Tax=Christensenella timonensis TaxID=1816678 RepID=UPI00082B4C83|nr:MurR/RpiR family transcriptional regulator [Christensenella timonensis]
MNNNVMDRINHSYAKMSKGQKLIADYILKEYDKAAFMTAATLSSLVGVSESTVVRFAYALGYDGYPKLQKDLQEVIQTKLTTAQRLNLMEGLTSEEVINASFKTDINNLRVTREHIDTKNIEQIVDSIDKARKIYILGTRSSGPLAEFLHYYMNYMNENIKLIRFDGSDIFNQILSADEHDVAIAISFPRYSMRTIEGMTYLKNSGCKVIAITDNEAAPPAQIADYTLTAKSYMNSFVDSFVAPLAVINLLIIMLGLRKKDILFANFNRLEELWQLNDVYATKELDAQIVDEDIYGE